MMKKPTLRKVLSAMALIAAVTGCGAPSDKNKETTQYSSTFVNSSSETTTAENTEVFKEFDWNSVPQSSPEIGAFRRVELVKM
jgi:hypothetical protein